MRPTFNNSSDTIFDIDHDRPEISYDRIAQYPRRPRDPSSKYDIRQKGLYGSWRVKPIEPLTLVLGSRVSWYDYSYISATQAAFSDVATTTQATNGRSHALRRYLIYDLNREWAVYASYTDVFEPQTNATRAARCSSR